MSNWEAKWSGKWPCKCSGQWSLYKDDKEVSIKIPFNGESKYDAGPAQTKSVYSRFSFENGWNEEWDTYEDGFDFPEWSELFKDFLEELTLDPKEWLSIYKAFQKEDWRPGSCGGCI